jgi:AbiV family abortive infection protein
MPEKFNQSAYLKLYRISHNNAIDLANEAEILFKAGRYCRAYALAFTALEEISKSQLAADVFTGLIPEQKFQKQYRDHKAKIGRMAWATNDAERYLSVDGEAIEVKEPTFVSRNDSMYVNIKDDEVISPTDVIGQDDAEGIIHTVNVALHRIFEVTEVWGHQIGTKGFMK